MQDQAKSTIIKDAQQKALKNLQKYSKPRYMAAIIESFISITLILGVQWAAMGLNLDAWKDPQFWIKSVASCMGIFMLYRAVVNAYFDKVANRPVVLKAKEEYEKKCNAKDLDLKDFLVEFNLNTKVEAYVGDVNARIERLEKKLKHCYKDRKIVRLNRKIDRLKELIDEDYINEHIERMNIKYYMVYYSDFTLDECSTGNNGLMTRGNYNKAFNKASFNKMGMYIISCMILSVSVFNIKEGMNWADFFINLVGSSFLIITRIATALMEADRLYDTTILAAINNKITILDQYQQWKEDHPSKTALELEKQKMRDKLREELKAEYEAKLAEQVESKANEIKALYQTELEKQRTSVV